MPPELSLPSVREWGCCSCLPAPAPTQAHGPAILLDVENVSPVQAREPPYVGRRLALEGPRHQLGAAAQKLS